eukprot:gene16166-22327_t
MLDVPCELSLQPEERAALESLKKLLLADGDMDLARHDDFHLVRFLKGRAWDVKVAQDMWKRSMEWRKLWHADQILEMTVLTAEQKARVLQIYPHGLHKTDHKGRPVLIYKLGQTNASALRSEFDADLLKRFHIQTYEFIMRVALPSCSKMVGRRLTQSIYEFDADLLKRIHIQTYEFILQVALPSCVKTVGGRLGSPRSSSTSRARVSTIIDLKGMGVWDMPKVKDLLMPSMSMNSSNYPSTLASLVILNAPMGFSSIFEALKGFLSPETQKKIQILGKTGSYESTLLKLIPSENLLPEFGGTSSGSLASNIGPWQLPQHYHKIKWGDALEESLPATPTTSTTATSARLTQEGEGISATSTTATSARHPQEGEGICTPSTSSTTLLLGSPSSPFRNATQLFPEESSPPSTSHLASSQANGGRAGPPPGSGRETPAPYAGPPLRPGGETPSPYAAPPFGPGGETPALPWDAAPTTDMTKFYSCLPPHEDTPRRAQSADLESPLTSPFDDQPSSSSGTSLPRHQLRLHTASVASNMGVLGGLGAAPQTMGQQPAVADLPPSRHAPLAEAIAAALSAAPHRGFMSLEKAANYMVLVAVAPHADAGMPGHYSHHMDFPPDQRVRVHTISTNGGHHVDLRDLTDLGLRVQGHETSSQDTSTNRLSAGRSSATSATNHGYGLTQGKDYDPYSGPPFSGTRHYSHAVQGGGSGYHRDQNPKILETGGEREDEGQLLLGEPGAGQKRYSNEYSLCCGGLHFLLEACIDVVRYLRLHFA